MSVGAGSETVQGGLELNCRHAETGVWQAVVRTLAVIGALFVVLPGAHAVDFTGVRLSEDFGELVISLSDGSSFNAPKLDDQDGFEQPQVSRDGKHAAWLARFPGLGASYSQPMYLVVIDRSRRLHRYAGNFGQVFRWCFGPGQSVVYAFSFAHGASPTVFERRRIDDGQSLGRYEIPEEMPSGSPLLENAPRWLRCIPRWQER